MKINKLANYLVRKYSGVIGSREDSLINRISSLYESIIGKALYHNYSTIFVNLGRDAPTWVKDPILKVEELSNQASSVVDKKEFLKDAYKKLIEIISYIDEQNADGWVFLPGFVEKVVNPRPDPLKIKFLALQSKFQHDVRSGFEKSKEDLKSTIMSDILRGIKNFDDNIRGLARDIKSELKLVGEKIERSKVKSSPTTSVGQIDKLIKELGEELGLGKGWSNCFLALNFIKQNNEELLQKINSFARSFYKKSEENLINDLFDLREKIVVFIEENKPDLISLGWKESPELLSVPVYVQLEKVKRKLRQLRLAVGSGEIEKEEAGELAREFMQSRTQATGISEEELEEKIKAQEEEIEQIKKDIEDPNKLETVSALTEKLSAAYIILEDLKTDLEKKRQGI